MHRKDDGARPEKAVSEAPGVTPGVPLGEEESTPSHVGVSPRSDTAPPRSAHSGEVRVNDPRQDVRVTERSGEVPSAVVRAVELPTDPHVHGLSEDPIDAIEEVSIASIEQGPINDPSSLKRQRIELAEVSEEVDLLSRSGDSSEARDGRPMSVTEGDRPFSGGPPPVPEPSNSGERGSVEAFPAVSLQDQRIGAILTGRYRIEKLIGKGGMGRVYLATQFPLNRPVAVKILNPEFQKKDPQFVRRFFLEASTAARLTHPNTITVFDYGESETGELFIVMEYLKGRPLSKAITAEAPFPAERTLHVAIQICRALREAHQKGIIHRDLKPGNILLLEEGDDADFVKVLDFGLVKLFTPTGQSGMGTEPLTPGPQLEQVGDLTRAGMFLGSPKYMSPEQIQGTPLDPRTDIYSLGVLMFQMIAGKPPYSGATSVEVIYKHVNHPVPWIAEIAPGIEVSDELEKVIRQCLSKQRDERFASMGDLLSRLKDVRRLLTGVSSADLGGSIPHANISVSESMAPLDVSGSASLSASRRPQTRPTSGSQSGSVGLSKPRVIDAPSLVPSRPTAPSPSSPASRAVIPPPNPASAFVDISDDLTPSGMVRQRAEAARRDGGGRMLKLAPILAGGALIVALGVLGYVYTLAPHRAEVSPGDSVERLGARISEVRVTFASTPEGAEVFDEGKRLGTTPFVHTYAANEAGDRPRKFVFKLSGFADEVIAEKLEAASVKIHARMRADTAGAVEPGKKGSESEYKENPY
jgi:eukaryotic-like serine/threonine-protein kinase